MEAHDILAPHFMCHHYLNWYGFPSFPPSYWYEKMSFYPSQPLSCAVRDTFRSLNSPSTLSSSFFYICPKLAWVWEWGFWKGWRGETCRRSSRLIPSSNLPSLYHYQGMLFFSIIFFTLVFVIRCNGDNTFSVVVVVDLVSLYLIFPFCTVGG